MKKTITVIQIIIHMLILISATILFRIDGSRFLLIPMVYCILIILYQLYGFLPSGKISENP